jgi:hypothetical protein
MFDMMAEFILRVIAAGGIALTCLIGFVVIGIANKYTDYLSNPVFWIVFLLIMGLHLTVFGRLFLRRRWAAIGSLILLLSFTFWLSGLGIYGMIAPVFAIAHLVTMIRAWPTLRPSF